MKRILLLFVSILACLGNSLKADHVVGSDILYKCLGNGKYEITFKFYRDCNGCNVAGGGGGGTGASCPHPTINIAGVNCNPSVTTVNINRISITDITPLCGSAKSKCAGGSFNYGIEEHLYKGIVDFSSSISNGCCKFKISTTIYVRSTTISTGAANQGFYTEATIDACNNICNSSPEYTSYPVAIICVGQDFVFNNGAIDTTDVGDSLSYSLAPAYQGAGSQVSYSGNFSPYKPMSFLGGTNSGLPLPAGFHLDSITGDLSFRPTKANETGVIVIEVTEWKRINGQMKIVGVTRRDMQVIAINCQGNNVPKIDPPYSAQGCAGNQVCLNIKTYDADTTTDTVKISWNKGIPKAVFTNNNGLVKFASGSVCWTPTEQDVSSVPYTFTITARDNACPLSGVSIRAFSIYVRESPKATRTLTKLTCGKVAVEGVLLKNNYPGLTIQWKVRDSVNQNYFTGAKLKDTIQMKPGRNITTLILTTTTPCVNAYADTIVIDPYVQVDLPKDTFICAGGSLQLNSSTKLGNSPYHYKWNTTSTDTLTSLLVTPLKDTMYSITVTDANTCSHTDSLHILYKPKPLISLDTGSRICYGDFVQLDAGNDTFPTTYTYLWNTSSTSRKLVVTDSNTYVARVKDSIGCTNTDTFRLYVNVVPTEAGPPVAICYNDTLKLTASGADTYKWYKLPSTSEFTSNPAFQEVLTADASYKVTGTKTYAGLTCQASDSTDVIVNPLPVITFGAIKDRCEKAPSFDLSEGLVFPTITWGTWSCIDDPDWVQSNLFYPDSVTVTGSSGFKVVGLKYDVTDGNGCKKSGATTVRIIQLPEIKLKDTSLCSDKGKVDLKSLTLSPTTSIPGTWKWSSPDPGANSAIQNNGTNAQFNLSIAPQGQTHSICLEITNLFGCPNSNCLKLTSRTVPVVDAGKMPKHKCANDTVFNLSEANYTPKGGIWQNSSGGLSGNTFNPTVVLPDSHKLTYTYDIPGNNCPVTDTLIVIVRPLPSITLIPPPDVCADAGIINLMSAVTPPGGTWSGTGFSGNGDFNASQHLGPQAFRYDYSNVEGCKSFITGGFKVDVKPVVQIVSSSNSCLGMPINLAAHYENTSGMLWTTNGAGTFNKPTDSVAQYTPGASDPQCLDFIATTNSNGACTPVSKNINICVYPIPTADIVSSPANEGCEPLNVNFEAITDLPTGAKYEWNFNDASGPEGNIKPTHTFVSNGVYNVVLKVTSDHNCTGTSTPLPITVYPVPFAAIDANNWITTVMQNTISFYDKTTIDAPDNIKDYLWSFGDPDSSVSTLKNPVFQYPSDTATYWVSLKVISNHNCESQTGRQLEILPQLRVFIPNAFIPDGIGEVRNERFYVTADGYKTFNIDIFSRWGELLYSSPNINEGWNGKYKDVPVQDGVYFYVVTILGEDGKTYRYNGTITLMR